MRVGERLLDSCRVWCAESKLRVVTMDLALSVLTQLLLAAPAEHHASRAPSPPPLPTPLQSQSQSPQLPHHCAASAAYVSAASSAAAAASASAAVVTQRLRELATAELQTSYLLLAHQLKRLMPKEVKVCIAF